MKFEILKRTHLKRNIMIGVVCIAIISAVVLNFTKAKYKNTESIPLVNGTINYSLADLNIVAITVDGNKVDKIPDGNYELTSESYCTVNGEKDSSIQLSYDSTTKGLSVTPMTTKGTKCYLYLNKINGKTMLETALQFKKEKRENFESIYSENTTKKIFQTNDWIGTSYYFAGNPTDNWVKFGGFYWRIIRINGDGSTRIIYQGSEQNITGEKTQIGTSAFNKINNASYYSGLKYTLNEQHGNTIKSTILELLDNWYINSNLFQKYSKYIDSNTGFCSDREMANGYSWSSQPKSNIYYATYDRKKNPSLDCKNENDILKIPIGLITTDEFIFAGGNTEINNTNLYLNTEQEYWTMSPSHFYAGMSYAGGFYINKGMINQTNNIKFEFGIRPVINLKSHTLYIGDGTIKNPYEVQ